MQEKEPSETTKRRRSLMRYLTYDGGMRILIYLQ